MHLDFQLDSQSRLFARTDVLRREYVMPSLGLTSSPATHFPRNCWIWIWSLPNPQPSRKLASLRRANDRLIKQERSEGLGPATHHLLALVDRARFREFISAAQRRESKIFSPSNTQIRGGHRTPAGGFTKVHRDFEVHPTTGLFHLVNLLIYLNREWPKPTALAWNCGIRTCWRLDPYLPEIVIDRLIRRLTPPFPGAFTHLDAQRLIIAAASPRLDAPSYIGRVPGRIVGRSPAQGWVDVLTGDGVLRVFSVLTPNSERPCAAASVIRSTRATLGLSRLDLLRRIVALEDRLASLEQLKCAQA